MTINPANTAITATPAIITRSIDAPPVNVGKIVREAVDVVEDVSTPTVEAEVVTAVNTAELLPEDDADDAEIADEEAVGVVKVEMIPFPLMG